MVVDGWLDRLAARRPHVLLAITPGATAARLATEDALVDVGAVVTASPADADVLVVVGYPGEEMADAIGDVWRQLPGPRVRTQVVDPAAAGAAIRAAVAGLSGGGQRAEALRRHDEWRTGADHRNDGDPDESPGHRGHAEHGGHGESMPMPGGLMMAERADDRDGLKLDVLEVTLGPVLADWPAGLVVTAAVQGDVVRKVDARVVGAESTAVPSFWDGADGRRRAAAHLDSLARLLAVVGWPAMAQRVRVVRDAALGAGPVSDVRSRLAVVDRRLRRSRTLRWATDGLGVLTPQMARRLDVTGPAARAADDGGDVTARWRCWLTDADAVLAGRDPGPAVGPRGRGRGDRTASAALLDAACRLMVGLDLAAARIVLASFDPDPDEIAVAVPRRVED
ncbi:hypothetical protein [Nucisporomicrobium flavum]|uniref:hypothetical protein n=1 Tax=Nucisporomicrobium flavum TaxID=2785915 RepID=UPI0018F53446|nr:hypothetical protein [Nucisporomicrobium flavum]